MLSSHISHADTSFDNHHCSMEFRAYSSQLKCLNTTLMYKTSSFLKAKNKKQEATQLYKYIGKATNLLLLME